MAKQRSLSTKKGTYDWVTGVSEHESLFLPEVSKGKKRLDPGFENIYGYELLYDIIHKKRNLFRKAIDKIDSIDFKKIDSGLLAYAKSSTTPNQDLNILKASILRAEGDDILLRQYANVDEGTKQIMPLSYFEDISELMLIDSDLLIKRESIIYYKKMAIRYTLQALKSFHKKLNDETDFEDMQVHRGQGNTRYYKTPLLKNKPDGLSVFTGIGKDGVQFFERQLLNSYTINRRVAEHFVVRGNNTRKYIIDAKIYCVLENLFSSFVACEYIDDGQYELLCLPNANRLFISERLDTDFITEFVLREHHH